MQGLLQHKTEKKNEAKYGPQQIMGIVNKNKPINKEAKLTVKIKI